MACHAFKATIVDFYLGETEQRIQKSMPICEVVYGQGANSIMNEAGDGVVKGKPSFRWYHLPANNVSDCNSALALSSVVLTKGQTDGMCRGKACAGAEFDLHINSLIGLDAQAFR